MKKCKKCDADYSPLFLWLPDDIWQKLGFKKKDFVCDHCIIESLKEITTFAYIVFPITNISDNKFYGIEILNFLTQKLDKFKNEYMVKELCPLNEKRKELYPDGIYRVKNHFDKGIKTYEYRSLTPNLITTDNGRKSLEQFILNVDKEIDEIEQVSLALK